MTRIVPEEVLRRRPPTEDAPERPNAYEPSEMAVCRETRRCRLGHDPREGNLYIYNDGIAVMVYDDGEIT